MYPINLLFNIGQAVGTLFQLIDTRRFKKNISDFRNAFLKRYDKFVLSYSFKTNYTAPILQIVKQLNGYAETVSPMEYEMAIKLGYATENIIFNGPIKPFDVFERAVLSGSIVNIDSPYEVDYLKQIRASNPTAPIAIGLRINMTLDTNKGESAIQSGLKESRFGLTDEMVSTIICQLKGLDIKIISLHGHTSTTNRLAINYKIIATKLLSICHQYNLTDLKYIDLGGGFFGAAPVEIDVTNKPTYDDYAAAICDVLTSDKWFMSVRPTIVIEPGTSVVCNVFELVTKIYQHKEIKNKHFVYVDASIFMVRPSRSKVNYPFNVYSERPDESQITANIVGSTCMEVDIIANDVVLNHYSNGDYLIFKANGAYRNNLTPFFINARIPIVQVGNDDFFVIRERQSANEMLNLLGY
jgi:diaminopimelate decarboxylase